MHPDDATRRGLSAGDLVRVTSKRGELLLPLVVSNEVGSGTVFAAMHWSGQFLASGGINEVSTGAVDPKSFQPELKHAAVRVEKATFGWNLLAARRGDALALQSAVQPLLRECAFASLSLRADADPASEQAWLVVRAAADSAPPQWVQRLADALQLQPGEHVLEYHDARRGLLERVGWGRDAHNDRIEGLLLSGGARDSASDALLDIALAGTAWTGSRLAVFTQRLPGGARDALVCQCMQVRESSIRAAITRGAGCGATQETTGLRAASAVRAFRSWCACVAKSWTADSHDLSEVRCTTACPRTFRRSEPMNTSHDSSSANTRGGKVSLVSAGPGDLELLTIKAVRTLATADVLMLDDLVDPQIVSLARGRAGDPRRQARRLPFHAAGLHLPVDAPLCAARRACGPSQGRRCAVVRPRGRGNRLPAQVGHRSGDRQRHQLRFRRGRRFGRFADPSRALPWRHLRHRACAGPQRTGLGGSTPAPAPRWRSTWAWTGWNRSAQRCCDICRRIPRPRWCRRPASPMKRGC